MSDLKSRAEYLAFLSESIPKPRTRDERQNMIEALAVLLVTASHVHWGGTYCAVEVIETVTREVLTHIHEALKKPI